MRKLKARRHSARPGIGYAVKRANKTEYRALRTTNAIAALRIEHGLTIMDVARLTGISFVSIWRIEQGVQRAKAKTVERIRSAIEKSYRSSKVD